jgi:hypothetical protein
MEFQRQTIREKVVENGWQIIELEKAEFDWWANEIWRLESLWSPIGETAFIAFLLEPEYAKEVWEITVSKDKPGFRGENSNSFSLNIKSSGWEKDLPEFMKFLSGLRNERALEK